jgi:hypothetical protein
MSSVDPSVSIDARRHFLQALRRALRPIIRLLIRSGVRYDEFADAARAAYVDSASHEGIGGITRPTVEQISWATGIEEEQVLHHCSSEADRPSEHVGLRSTQVMSEILHRWHTDPQYLGSYGIPLELEIDSQPNTPSFRALVSQADRSADAEAILRELLSARSVMYSGDSRIRALTRFYIWPRGNASGIDYFGATLARMIDTHEHNLTSASNEGKRLERSVFADHGLPGHLLPKFQFFATERASQFLCELDDWLGENASSDLYQSSPRADIGVNLFFYVESPADAESLSTLVQPRRRAFPQHDSGPP